MSRHALDLRMFCVSLGADLRHLGRFATLPGMRFRSKVKLTQKSERESRVLLAFSNYCRYVCMHWVYFEGVSVTPVILATVRGEGRLRAAGRYVVSAGLPGSAGLPDEFQIAHFIYVFKAKIARTSLRCNVFYFFIPLSSKTPIFESFFWKMACQKCSQN